MLHPELKQLYLDLSVLCDDMPSFFHSYSIYRVDCQKEPSVDGPEEPRGVVLVETTVSIWIPVVEVLVLIWIQAWRKKLLDDSGVRFSTREKES